MEVLCKGLRPGGQRQCTPGNILILAESYVAALTAPAVRQMMFGDVLRKAAEAAPHLLALQLISF
jgi:hypothetical protein